MVGSGKYKPATTRLGAYEILRPLAKGGMAELFLARAVGLEGFEKLVVLKRVLPHYAENPRFVRSFLDEAKLVAGFDHPHIAHVHDMGKIDGSYFFTMEFVHGVDLRTILRRCVRDGEKLPIAIAMLIARNIASALHYAHERRGPHGRLLDVVHRDVSPSNIIVSYDGAPKLIDFGIAKAANSSIKTETGALKGKISYMSPEQAKGAPVDRRTDIFALGIVLWEMTATRRLYKSDNEMATIQRIIYEPPPSPRTSRPDCPPGLERIVMRALALDATARYQTARELESDLEELALELRLKQSSIELGNFMHRMFADELRAWNLSLSAAATVTDAIAVHPADDATDIDSIDDIDGLFLGGTADDEDDVPAAVWPAVSAPPAIEKPVPAVITAVTAVPIVEPVPAPPPMPALPPSVLVQPVETDAVSSARPRWLLVGLALSALAVVLVVVAAWPEEDRRAAAPRATPVTTEHERDPVDAAPAREPERTIASEQPPSEPQTPAVIQPPAAPSQVATQPVSRHVRHDTRRAAVKKKPATPATPAGKPAATPSTSPDTPPSKPKPKFDPNAVFPPS